MKLIHLLVMVAFFTASFDVFLVVNLGGVVRLEQIVMVFVILAAAGWIVQNQRILWPRGGTAILLFCLVNTVLIFQWGGLLFGINLQLLLLLFLSVFGIFAVLQLYGLSTRLQSLMRGYLLSYVFVACCGLFQFVAPALHLGAPLIVQWIKHGLIPRINGFNYEPSYFATYLVMGWIALVDLRVTGARLTEGKRWFWLTVIVSLALFLSTSKTAWIFMILEGLLRARPYVARFIKKRFARLREGILIAPRLHLGFLATIVALAVLIPLGLTQLSRVVDLNIFLSGSGLNGTAAHSLVDRANRLNDTSTVVRNNLWLGAGLGGTSVRIAAIHGATVDSLLLERFYQGFPVPLDVVASSGLIGAIPFLWFFLVITLGESRLIRERWSDDRAKWLHALIRALAFEWLFLLADQYLLRAYLWFHVTMVVVVAYNLRFVPTPSSNPASTPFSNQQSEVTAEPSQGLLTA